MAKNKRIESMEDQAARLERKAREMKRKAAQLRKEEMQCENARAGDILRSFWKEGFDETNNAEFRDAIAEIFGSQPSQKVAKNESLKLANKASGGANETSPFGS